MSSESRLADERLLGLNGPFTAYSASRHQLSFAFCLTSYFSLLLSLSLSLPLSAEQIATALSTNTPRWENTSSNGLIRAYERSSGANVTVIPHSGAIKVSTDTERGSDKGMQMNSGIVMKLAYQSCKC